MASSSKTKEAEILSRLIKERRSIRKFSNSQVEKNLLEEIFEDIRFMPCPTNRQCFRFIAIQDSLRIQAMRQEILTAVEAIAQALAPEEGENFRKYGHLFTFFDQTPTVIVGLYRVFASRLPTNNRNSNPIHGIAEIQAFGGAMAALLLSLKARNLDSCWMSGPLIAEKKILSLLGIETPWRLGAVIPVGKGQEALKPPKKPSLDRVFTYLLNNSG